MPPPLPPPVVGVASLTAVVGSVVATSAAVGSIVGAVVATSAAVGSAASVGAVVAAAVGTAVAAGGLLPHAANPSSPTRVSTTSNDTFLKSRIVFPPLYFGE